MREHGELEEEVEVEEGEVGEVEEGEVGEDKVEEEGDNDFLPDYPTLGDFSKVKRAFLSMYCTVQACRARDSSVKRDLELGSHMMPSPC